MGKLFYLKTARSSLPIDVRLIARTPAVLLSDEDLAKVRKYQKPVNVYYDMAVSRGKTWEHKFGRKEIERAAKRLAKVA